MAIKNLNGATLDQLKQWMETESGQFSTGLESRIQYLQDFKQKVRSALEDQVKPSIDGLADSWRGDARIALVNDYRQSMESVPQTTSLIDKAVGSLQTLRTNIGTTNEKVQAIEPVTALEYYTDVGVGAVGGGLVGLLAGPWGAAAGAVAGGTAGAEWASSGPGQDEAAQQARALINDLGKDYDAVDKAQQDLATVVWHGKQSMDQTATLDGPGPADPRQAGPPGQNPNAPTTPKQNGNPTNANNLAMPSNQNGAGNTGNTSAPGDTGLTDQPADTGTPLPVDTGLTDQPADTGTPLLAASAPPTAQAPVIPGSPVSVPTASSLPKLDIPSIPVVKPDLGLASSPSFARSAPGSGSVSSRPLPSDAAAAEPNLSARTATGAAEPEASRFGAPFYPPPMGGMGAGAGRQGSRGVQPGVAKNQGAPRLAEGGKGKGTPKNVGIPADLVGRSGGSRGERRAAGSPRKRSAKPKSASSEVLDEELWEVETPATGGR